MNKMEQDVTELFKTSSFYCQEIIISSPNLPELVADIKELCEKYPHSLSNLNLVINFSDQRIKNYLSEEFVLEAKKQLSKLGHNVVGAIGLERKMGKNCNIQLVNHKPLTQLNQDKREQKEKDLKETLEKVSTKHNPVFIDTIYVEENIRGGQSYYAKDANLVIIGDVKRGAEIAADYSVIVFGKMEGRVHAGVSCSKSIVSANCIDPEVISICGVFIANQDIPQNFLGENALIKLNQDESKLIIHSGFAGDKKEMMKNDNKN